MTHYPERDIIQEWEDFYSQWEGKDRHFIQNVILRPLWAGCHTSFFWHGPCQKYTDMVNEALEARKPKPQRPGYDIKPESNWYDSNWCGDHNRD